MSGEVSLVDLVGKIRKRANMENSQFVTDPEIKDYVNSSIADLYDLICTHRGEQYFEKNTSVSIVNGQEAYDLPDDFYKVEVLMSASGFPIDTFDRREAFHKAMPLKYNIMNNKLVVNRTDSSCEVKLYYIPLAPTLVLDDDTTDFYNGWERYVILDVAIICLNKEESDTSQLERELMKITERIESASNKNDHQPHKIVDVEGVYRYEDREVY